MNELVLDVLRRAILDLLNDIGVEQNDDVLTRLLHQLAHPVARRDVKKILAWLAERDLIKIEQLGPYMVARIAPDGRDVADSRLRIDGISRFKTGE